MSETELRIEKMSQSHVGNGVTIVDPQVIEDNIGEQDKFWNYLQTKKVTLNCGQGFQKIVIAESFA